MPQEAWQHAESLDLLVEFLPVVDGFVLVAGEFLQEPLHVEVCLLSCLGEDGVDLDQVFLLEVVQECEDVRLAFPLTPDRLRDLNFGLATTFDDVAEELAVDLVLATSLLVDVGGDSGKEALFKPQSGLELLEVMVQFEGCVGVEGVVEGLADSGH